MNIKNASLMHVYEDIIVGDGVKFYQKLYRDIKKIYKSIDESLQDEKVMYEVYSCEEPESYLGSVNWGLTVLYPIEVNGECNMTRGHFHQNIKCNEFYYGAKGEGLLLLMDQDGEVMAEKVCAGSLHNIKGTVAHRLVNTGDQPLKVIAAWSSEAGHDYEQIENHPFPIRVFKEAGKIRIVEDE